MFVFRGEPGSLVSVAGSWLRVPPDGFVTTADAEYAAALQAAGLKAVEIPATVQAVAPAPAPALRAVEPAPRGRVTRKG